MSIGRGTSGKADEVLVSFIVPTRNSVRTIRACLDSIRAQHHPRVELMVVDNGSVDGTFECAEAVADIAQRGGPERSAQRNHGARMSSGQLLVFIDSDMVLEPEIAGEAAAFFSANERLGAAVIPELSFGEGFWARCRSLEKLLYLGDPAVEAARIFRRSAFEQLGGYDESLTGPEDYDLPDRVRRAGWEPGRVSARVWHDEGRVHLPDLFRKKRYYGRTLAAYLGGSSSTRSRSLVRTRMLSNPRLLLREPVRAAGLVLLKLVDTAGLASGMLEARLNRHRTTS